MILLIDDNRDREQEACDPRVFDGCTFADFFLVKRGLAQDINIEALTASASCILLHESTWDLDTDGSHIPESYLTATLLIEELMREPRPEKPYVIFSGGMGEVRYEEGAIFEMPKTLFYKRLFSFLDDFRQSKKIDLRILAEGPGYGLKQAGDVVLMAIRNLKEQDVVRVEAFQPGVLENFFSLLEDSGKPDEIISQLIRKPPLKSAFEKRIRAILSIHETA